MARKTVSGTTVYSAISPAPQAGDDIYLSGTDCHFTIDTETAVLSAISGDNSLGHTLTISAKLNCSGPISAQQSWGTADGIIYLANGGSVLSSAESAAIMRGNADGGGGSVISTATTGTFEIDGNGNLSVGDLYGTELDLENVILTDVASVGCNNGCKIRNTVFDADTGLFTISATPAGKDLDIDGFTHYGAGNSFYINAVTAPDSGKIRSVKRMSIADTFRTETISSVTFENCYVRRTGNSNGSYGSNGIWVNCFVGADANDPVFYPLEFSGILLNTSSSQNVHWIGTCAKFENTIFESIYDSLPFDEGNGVMFPSPGFAVIGYVRKCVMVNSDAWLVSLFGNANITMSFDSNLIFGLGIGLGESYTTLHEGMVSSVRNNIHIPDVTTSKLVDALPSSELVDGCVVVADHNAIVGSVSDPYDATGNPDIFGTSPGTGDITSDPQFKGGGKKSLEDWAVDHGCEEETRVNRFTWAFTRLASAYDPSSENYLASTEIDDVMLEFADWLTPTNSDYATAGYGGTYIGPYEPSSGTVCTIASNITVSNTMPVKTGRRMGAIGGAVSVVNTIVTTVGRLLGTIGGSIAASNTMSVKTGRRMGAIGGTIVINGGFRRRSSGIRKRGNRRFAIWRTP
jgi:hypothetical protein